VILRGGSESLHSTAAIHDGLVAGLLRRGFPRPVCNGFPWPIARPSA